MKIDTFYRGFLLALREKCNSHELTCYGDTYQEAFGATIKYAREQYDIPLFYEIELEYDPMFGVYSHASSIILSGMRDFLLALLGPTYQKAAFIITKEDSTKELNNLPFSNIFRDLALKFFEYQTFLTAER